MTTFFSNRSKQTKKQPNQQTNKQKQTSKQTNNKQTNKQTNKQQTTNKQTQTNKSAKILHYDVIKKKSNTTCHLKLHYMLIKKGQRYIWGKNTKNY